MDAKLGVYVCSGCEIGDCLDVDKVAGVFKEAKCALGKTHEALCSPEGIELIKNDIASEELTGVIIAACSARVKVDEFDFGDTLVERAPIREWAAWTLPKGDEDDKTTEAAQDCVRMFAEKAKGTTPIELEEIEVNKDILVIGGGMTGLSSALDVAKAGYKAILVEKEDDLGGLGNRFHKTYPTQAPFESLVDTPIKALVDEVESHDNITVHKGATVEKIEGAPGLFDVTIGGGATAKAGAIVLATGADQYDPTKLDHLGYGKSDKVITSLEFEDMARQDKLSSVKSVAFIQCAGSRDKDHLPYCSGHCCMTSLKQAKYLREANKDGKAFIFYRDMRTPGTYEAFYRAAQDDDGIFMTKGDIESIEPSGGGVQVEVDNTLLGEKVAVDVDLVVLATGMVPTTKTEYDDKLDAGLVGAPKDPDEKKDEDEEAESDRPPATVLNLAYRQAPELPNLKYGFPDSHFICFPYETRRTGIYAAGAVRKPSDLEECKHDAAGAALKAIQCVELIQEGKAVHPRVGDQSFITINFQRCTQCKRCTEECPFGALNEDEKGNPMPNPTRCRRCGTCMGACPERVISFQNYSVPLIGNMIKNIEVPDEFDEKPRIVCFLCENDALPALDIVAQQRKELSPWVRFVPMRCLGGVNLVWVADSLGSGIDGILFLGCRHGDDYQCHFVKGSELATIRLSKVEETLQRLVLEPERIKFEEVQLSDYEKLPGIINEFAEAISEMDPNPYKDM